MTEEARRKRNEYQREWRRRNPEKVRAIRERYEVRKVEREDELMEREYQEYLEWCRKQKEKSIWILQIAHG